MRSQINPTYSLGYILALHAASVNLSWAVQIFGENACHPERSEGSGSTGGEILRCAQDDSQDPSPVRFREAFSPNIWGNGPLGRMRSDRYHSPIRSAKFIRTPGTQSVPSFQFF